MSAESIIVLIFAFILIFSIRWLLDKEEKSKSTNKSQLNNDWENETDSLKKLKEVLIKLNRYIGFKKKQYEGDLLFEKFEEITFLEYEILSLLKNGVFLTWGELFQKIIYDVIEDGGGPGGIPTKVEDIHKILVFCEKELIKLDKAIKS